MTTLLKMTVEYDPERPYLSLDVASDQVQTVALEKRFAGWYATLDYTDSDGTRRSITPDSWIRYRDIYTLEYQTEDDYYALKIKPHKDSAKLTVYLGVQSQYQ